MKITASQVNELRKKTGSGMMDCKKALVEAEGDMETAIDILRKKGQKVAAKRSDRETGEGLVLANINANGSRGYLVVLGCETDFVAKNDTYNQLTQSFVKIAMDNNPKQVVYSIQMALFPATIMNSSISNHEMKKSHSQFRSMGGHEI